MPRRRSQLPVSSRPLATTNRASSLQKTKTTMFNEFGQPYVSSAFPGRKLTHTLSGSGGEWLQVYREEQIRRFEAIVCADPLPSSVSTGRYRRARRAGSTPELSTSPAPRSILDGFFLLRKCAVEDPSDLCSCNISACGLCDVNVADLKLFDNVARVNAADNRLPLGSLAAFPSLRELDLPMNDVRDVELALTSFPHLEVLDLSYNQLSSTALVKLGALPRLRELNLSGNELSSLPAEMSRMGQESGHVVPYPRLEKLILSNNKLLDMKTFAVLAGLQKLEELELDGNKIVTVPLLKLLNRSTVQQLPEEKFEPGSEDQCQQRNASAAAGLTLPFPSLKRLNLAKNKIADASDLLPVVGWPVLEVLVIHGNPLTGKTRGMPTLLKDALVERGIDVIRTEPREAHRPSANSGKLFKVKDRPLPIIPKLPLALPSSPQSRLEERSSVTPLPPLPPIHHVPEESGPGVFLTQLDEKSREGSVERSEAEAPRDFRNRDAEKPPVKKTPDVASKDYQIFYDAKDDPSVFLPSDVRSTAQSLRRLLNQSLTVHPTSRLLDRKAYSPKQQATSEKLAVKAPSLGETKAAELNSLLTEMKANLSTVEESLDSALAGISGPSLKKEATKLLSQMQAKFDDVRQESLRTSLDNYKANAKASASQVRGHSRTPTSSNT
ncbi:X-ray radiation resistance-associated protein 1-like [Oscarella lobularis]|uniref:X-ray radiation resistance-associated protein 1-like n=1 Tax=Oscarella lobularis TaxID=121494 RepID=UPI0033139BD8